MQASPQPRWLSDEEQRAWISLCGVLIRLPAALDARMQEDVGLSTFEYLVLSWLSMAEQRSQRMSDLADLTNSSLSRLSHVARRLEQRGWLERRPDPEDSRYVLATLTDSGWSKVVDSAPGHVEAVRRLVFDRLTAGQVEALGEACSRIAGAAGPS